MAKTDMIRFERVSKTYGRGNAAVRALIDLSLEIPFGSYWAIMGPSGSGKSTLLHLLGLLDRPSEGRLILEQKVITPATNLSELARLRRESIGFIFQQFFLLPRATALENVVLPGLYAGLTHQEAAQRAVDLLERVGLGRRTNHRPNQLSGGEQQRVAIARALMNNPPIILADEPTGNLDSQTGRAILEILETLKSEGKTVVIVTHDASIAKRTARTVHLQDGKVV